MEIDISVNTYQRVTFSPDKMTITTKVIDLVIIHKLHRNIDEWQISEEGSSNPEWYPIGDFWNSILDRVYNNYLIETILLANNK